MKKLLTAFLCLVLSSALIAGEVDLSGKFSKGDKAIYRVSYSDEISKDSMDLSYMLRARQENDYFSNYIGAHLDYELDKATDYFVDLSVENDDRFGIENELILCIGAGNTFLKKRRENHKISVGLNFSKKRMFISSRYRYRYKLGPLKAKLVAWWYAPVDNWKVDTKVSMALGKLISVGVSGEYRKYDDKDDYSIMPYLNISI